MEKFDLGIVGGGPAGYTAAFQARRLGKSVVMFEKDAIGGVCLNRGCIPTKTILHSAELFEEMQKAASLGIEADNLRLDFAKVIQHKDEVVEKLRRNLELALKNSGTVVVKEFAEILDEHKINSGGQIYECEKIISATGSAPLDLPSIKFDGKFILSSDDILELKTLPKKIVIIGSGAIGTEWARIFSSFGVEVVIVEWASSLLPSADFEVSKRLERIFKLKKIKFYTSTSAEKVEIIENSSVDVFLSNGEKINADFILLAAGRKTVNSEKISGVSYIGDEAREIQLAHYAIRQAIKETTGISYQKSLIPSVIYGCPEIAWVGLREQDLEDGSFQKSLYPISALGKSHCDNCIEGFVKILSREGKILGAHIVAKEASALIQQLVIAIQNEIPIGQLKEVCFAHPTYSEGIFESLLNL